jgi:hypothetical protein
MLCGEEKVQQLCTQLQVFVRLGWLVLIYIFIFIDLLILLFCQLLCVEEKEAIVYTAVILG